jgi:hypothetical protein
MDNLKHFRSKELQGHREAFKYLAAGLLGGTFVANVLLHEGHRGPLVLACLFLFSLWCVYQLESHIKSIERWYEDYLTEGDEASKASRESMVTYLTTRPLWKIIFSVA